MGRARKPLTPQGPRFGRREALIALGATVAGGLSRVFADKEETSSSVNKTLSPDSSQSESIEKTDALISKVEQGFAAFEAKVMPLIEGISDQNMKAELKASFEILRINQANPNRNYERLISQEKDGAVIQQDLNHFSYRATETPGYAATYHPVSRYMSLSPDFDPSNLFDLLVLFHELKHVVHDSNIRRTFRTEHQFHAYVNFHSGNRVLLSSEMDAYAYEIELLNVIMEGELEKAIQEGREINVEALATVSEDPQADARKISDLLILAKLYYQGGGLAGMYTDKNNKFVAKIAEIYRKKGHELFLQTQGGLVRYEDYIKQ